MPLAIAVIVLVVGSVLFHFLSPWYFTPLASNWGQIDMTIDITLWVTGVVFVAVNLFMAYAIIKYRKKEGSKAHYDPENARLETILTIVTTVGVAAMLAPGLLVWASFVKVPEGAMEVEAVGQQWHWSYRLPGDDGQFGNVDTNLISGSNPFGMDADDPHGQDDILIMSPEVHIPIDVPVKFNLRSKDVLHDFAVAQFRVKMDLVPGMETYLWLTPTVLGRYEVLCEELCGIAHHTMRGAVVVDEQADFEAWAAGYPTYEETTWVVAGDAEAGALQFTICSSCHGQNGEGMQALNAPKLAGQADWYLKSQIKSYQDNVRGAHEDDTLGKQMAPMARTLSSETAINNVVAYIQTLPDKPAPATITGDVLAGEKVYAVCSYCHGGDGLGVQAMNAPRLAGMTDWYLAHQLNNFKDGIRGEHRSDYYGKQMGYMAKILHDDDAVKDLIAYINTL
jgi:cytochrome c oxidase subunit 2